MENGRISRIISGIVENPFDEIGIFKTINHFK